MASQKTQGAGQLSRQQLKQRQAFRQLSLLQHLLVSVTALPGTHSVSGCTQVSDHALLADADAMMADNMPHHGQDASNTGSPGSETSQQETSPAQFLSDEDWADHMILDTPHQQLPLHPHHPVHPHPSSHHEHLKSLQEGTHAEQSSTKTLHPPPVQPDNLCIDASLSGHTSPHRAPGVRDADCQHQELVQTPDAALDAAHDDDWYDELQPLESSDSECCHYSMGDDSPLSRLADSGYHHDMALSAALSAKAPAHQVYSRAQILNAIKQIEEADVATQLNSTYAKPVQKDVIQPPAVLHRQNILNTKNPRVNGRKSRKRAMTTEEPVPEAVLHHNSRHAPTRPTASPTAVNQPHAVPLHPHHLQQHSAAHFRAGVQHHERHEAVQQAQAGALPMARGAQPRRKRRKTAGIPFSAAPLTLPTAAATQAALAPLPMPNEVSAAADTTAPAAASTAASAAAIAAAVAVQPSVPGMTRPAGMQYQQGDVVWAKLGSDPYWPARVSPVPCIWYLA